MFGLLDGMFTGWKVWAAIGIIVAIISASFGAGWQINSWRMNATFADEKAHLNDKIHELESKLSTQSAAVDILDEKTKNAIERKKLAEKYSAELVNQINRRKAVIENSTATDCEGVLKEAHEDAR